MAVSVSFYLNYTKERIAALDLAQSYVPIRCEVRYTQDSLPWNLSKRLGRPVHRIRFTLDVRAMPKLWAHGRVKPTHPDASRVNARMDGIAQRAISLHREYIEAGEMPSNEVYTLAILGSGEVPQTGSFFDDYERYIRYCEGRTSKSFSDSQKLILQRVKEFERWSGRPVTYSSINKTWGKEFVEWMREVRKGRKMAHGTGNKYLKQFRMFLNHATSEGWSSSTGHKQIKIKENRNAFPITLTESEVLSLWALKDEDIAHLPPRSRKVIFIARDWFVLATQTALRFSDWAPERIDIVQAGAGKNFRLYQQKSVLPIEIPLSDLAASVLARHGGIMPAPLTPAPTLSHIKILCKIAGIRKHITTHTARRTFATLQERAGVPRSIIMRITGHKTERDYLKYVGVTFEHNADMLRKANPDWFKAETG